MEVRSRDRSQKRRRSQRDEHKRSSSSRSKSHRHPIEKVVPKGPVVKMMSLIWNVVFYLFVFAVFIGALLFNINKSPDKSFYGYRFMTVKTNSMAPNSAKPDLKDGFVAGDIIILKQVPVEELKVKDIITFYPVQGNTTAFLTHRIIEIDTPIEGSEGQIKGLTTQGDANSGKDIPISKKQVVGKVITHVSSIGRLIEFVRGHLVIVLVLISVLFGFSLTLKYYLSIPQVEESSRRKK